MATPDPAATVESIVLARWALGVQMGVVYILAFFFLLLARSVKLQSVRLWALAWFADAVALWAVYYESFLNGFAGTARAPLLVYAAAKTAFALLFTAGAWDHVERGVRLPIRPIPAAAVIALWSLLLGYFAPHLVLVQVGEALMVGSLMVAGAFWVLRHPLAARCRWLGWAMVIDGLLFLHYVPVLLPSLWARQPLAPYAPYSSFLDAGTELLLGLGALVALEGHTTEHLLQLNRELEASQERLRQLVDLDPLTGLLNRRRFRDEMATRAGEVTTLLFLDLDGFKSINDRYGHSVGDTCLKRVASSLARLFRPEDVLFRWGGDEFLAVCSGIDTDQLRHRIEELRQSLREPEAGAPGVHLSCGIARIGPGGAVDAALREADRDMYEEKERRRSGPRSGRFSIPKPGA